MLLVIPMAGRGSRYADKGFERPKPLIEVAGKPMLQHAFRSVSQLRYRKVVFVALKEHEEAYDLHRIIREEVVREFELVLLDDITEGQLCTVLEASGHFQEGEGLLIAASDSYVALDRMQEDIDQRYFEGLISVIELPGEQWSFAKTDEQGRVIEVAEKQRISDWASTGVYYFSDAKVFQQEAEQLIAAKETTKGEYYVMPLYNRYLVKDRPVGISKAAAMWDMGTPEAKRMFEEYLKNRP
ncbi:MAG: sugar phosphate nucleotidyltransferase [Saprospiraceae bacterium]